MSIRKLTEEEKKKFADNVSVEVESAPDSTSPEDLVLAQIEDYDKNMKIQLNKMKYMIEANNRILDVIDKLYTNSTVDELKDIYKEEVGSRQNILVQLHKSMAVMQERLEQTDKIKELVVKDLELLKTIDFYFGNQLKIMTVEELNSILEKHLGK